MDIFSVLQREWPLIAAAPVIAIGGAFLVAITCGGFAWWLRASIDDGELRAFRAQLELARQREANARDRQADLERDIAALQTKIAESPSAEEFKSLSDKVDEAFVQLSNANNAVHYALTHLPYE